MKTIAVLAFLLLALSCHNGKRCAYVHIYNPKTGSENDLDLQVDVKNGKIVKIYWANGGWLDETHFDPEDAYLDGKYASFEDDRGREFGIILQDEENCD